MSARAYRCAPTIAWVKDANQTILVETGAPDAAARSWTLRGVEAVVWDLLALGYPFEKIVRFLTMLPDHSAAGAPRPGEFAAAKKTLLAILHQWEQTGIVQAIGGTGHG